MKPHRRRAIAAVVVTLALLAGSGTPARAQIMEVIATIPGLDGLFGGLSSAIGALQTIMQRQVDLTDIIEDSYNGSYDISHGNVGRMTEVENALWWFGRDGNGLSTSDDPGRPGSFNQRIPGVTDEAGWLDVLAAPRLGDPAANTVLLGGRPATETTAAQPSAFRRWPVPRGPAWSNPGITASREARDRLGDVAEGTATWRTAVWDDIEAALPPATTEADIQALNLGSALETRAVDRWRRGEQRAAADLQHAHAIAEAASTLAAQVGEVAAHLAALRDDDLMREQRVDQSVLANGVTQTELLLAQAQLLAQQQAREARERYEAEQRRREEMTRWQAEMAASAADWQALQSDIAAQQGAREAARRSMPDPSTWYSR